MATRSRESSSSVSVRTLREQREGWERIARRARAAIAVPARLARRAAGRLGVIAERRRLAERLLPSRSPEAEATAPRRLIQHNYCHTSKPTYISALKALAARGRVAALYAAVKERVWRFARPMARALRPWLSRLERILRLLKKRAGDWMTRILKAARGWAEARIEWLRASPAHFAVMRGTIARVLAAALGRRELYYTGDVKHCSSYAVIRGLRYAGPPSGWYHWHRRYAACNQLAAGEDYAKRYLCRTWCTDLLALAEPQTADALWTRMLEIAHRIGCAPG